VCVHKRIIIIIIITISAQRARTSTKSSYSSHYYCIVLDVYIRTPHDPSLCITVAHGEHTILKYYITDNIIIVCSVQRQTRTTHETKIVVCKRLLMILLCTGRVCRVCLRRVRSDEGEGYVGQIRLVMIKTRPRDSCKTLTIFTK